MKILIFSTAYLPFVGGAELAIKEITDRLSYSPFVKGSTRPSEAGRDFSFSLITARFKRDVPAFERIGNVEVHRVGFGTRFDKWLLPWLGFWKAKQLEKTEHFDVLWSMMASQASISATWFKELNQDKKLVLTLQEGDEEAHLKRYVFGNEFFYQLFIHSWHVGVFKQANVITAISNYLAERARKNSSAEVVVIPNGVNAETFSGERLAFSEEKRQEFRESLGFEKGDKIIITTSRLVQKNGVEDIIESLRYLPDHVKLLICGTGELESGLRLTANRYTLTARVKFQGFVPHQELPRYLHAADIFCRPSLSEGMGSSFIEAMAAGVPVVATPVGGIPDFLTSPSFKEGDERGSFGKEKITGLFCEVQNPKSIAEKVELLLSSDELRNRIIINASKMVREKYDWDGIAERMKEVF